MEDITPGLIKKIQTDFQYMFGKSDNISALYAKVRDGTATYAEANNFAIETGEILATAFSNNLSSAVLPEGRMHYNIAQRIIEPMMVNNYNLVSNISLQVQEILNKSANIGIRAIKPELNTDKIKGIVDKVSSADDFDKVAWVLNEPIKTFSQSIVDDAIRENAEFHSKSGLQPKIVRRVAGNCCEWCSNLAGSYMYPDRVPHDVYRRHQRCRCTVDYNPGDGKIQNVHTKRWKNQEERDKIESRKSLGAKSKTEETPVEKEKRIEQENNLSLADRIASHPKMLQAYTPQGLKKSLEKAGYDVKPLGRGKYKGVTFENGGGFKINYGGDKLLQYHPEKGSHHNGAYYKISSGQGGVVHYELDGTEKKNVQ